MAPPPKKKSTSSKKRQQQRHRSASGRLARQAAAQSARRANRRKWTVIAMLSVIILGLVLSQVVTGGDDGGREAPVQLVAPSKGGIMFGETPCPDPGGGSARTTSFRKPPPMCIDVAKSYTAAIETSKGLITVDLDVKNAPKTVNNFVVLARYHFYDGIPFHRIAAGQFIQGGSPDATGAGSPGYTFEDELPVTPYEIGTMAMANSGPDTNGSQFFFVVGDRGVSVLSPAYSILGKVAQGMSVLKAIEKKGSVEAAADSDGGKPTEMITIESVTIKET